MDACVVVNRCSGGVNSVIKTAVNAPYMARERLASDERERGGFLRIVAERVSTTAVGGVGGGGCDETYIIWSPRSKSRGTISSHTIAILD